MRQIKFRAWDIESKFMLAWDEMQEVWESEGYFSSIFRNDHYHCMQFTGLYDKNGVEIYEGDVLQVYRYPERGGVVVEWVDGVHYGEHSGYLWCSDEARHEWVIIGNIHQNPDLMDRAK